jgi:hypothetical protein
MVLLAQAPPPPLLLPGAAARPRAPLLRTSLQLQLQQFLLPRRPPVQPPRPSLQFPQQQQQQPPRLLPPPQLLLLLLLLLLHQWLLPLPPPLPLLRLLPRPGCRCP